MTHTEITTMLEAVTHREAGHRVDVDALEAMLATLEIGPYLRAVHAALIADLRALRAANAPTIIAGLLAEVAALRKVREWQPMEAAPKDGTVVALWADTCYPIIGWYDAGKREWQDVWEHQWSAPRQPTHWKPLSQPPGARLVVVESAGGGGETPT